MAPARVDSNKKREKSSINWVEEELFCIDTRNCDKLPESSRWAPVDLLEVIVFFIQQTFPF